MAHPADSADPRWSVFMRNSTAILPWIGLENRRHISMGFPPDVWPNVVNLACNAPHDAIVPVRVSKRGGGGSMIDSAHSPVRLSPYGWWITTANDAMMENVLLHFPRYSKPKRFNGTVQQKLKKSKMQSFFLNRQDCSKKKLFRCILRAPTDSSGADASRRRRRRKPRRTEIKINNMKRSDNMGLGSIGLN